VSRLHTAVGSHNRIRRTNTCRRCAQPNVRVERRETSKRSAAGERPLDALLAVILPRWPESGDKNPR